MPLQELTIFSLAQLLALAAPVHRRLTRAAHPKLMTVLRHLGAPGLFFLAIADSTPIPTLGGVDILLAILAARHLEPWWAYAVIATGGSVLGAYLTFRAARAGGSEYLKKKFGQQRVTRFLDLFERWGTSGLAVSASVPFPFPTSALFAAAGVLAYPTRRFLAVVAAARGLRCVTVALVAFHYGRHFIRALRNPSQYYGWLIFLGILVLLLVAGAAIVQRRLNAPTGLAESA